VYSADTGPARKRVPASASCGTPLSIVAKPIERWYLSVPFSLTATVMLSSDSFSSASSQPSSCFAGAQSARPGDDVAARKIAVRQTNTRIAEISHVH
jgi:hypothetical protein